MASSNQRWTSVSTSYAVVRPVTHQMAGSSAPSGPRKPAASSATQLPSTMVSSSVKAMMAPRAAAMPTLRARDRPRTGARTMRTRGSSPMASATSRRAWRSAEVELSTMTSSSGGVRSLPASRAPMARARCGPRPSVHSTTETSGEPVTGLPVRFSAGFAPGIAAPVRPVRKPSPAAATTAADSPARSGPAASRRTGPSSPAAMDLGIAPAKWPLSEDTSPCGADASRAFDRPSPNARPRWYRTVRRAGGTA
nr:hypothetical protein [Corynebacterium hansenii]